VYDLWDDASPAAAAATAQAAAAAKRPKPPKSKTVPVPALAICPPGASYHPTAADHQHLIAQAVAVEHMKELEAEARPVRPPALGAAVAAQLAQEMLYMPEDVEDDEEPEGEEEEGGAGPRKVRRLSRADKNRRGRGKEQERLAAAAAQLKRQRRELEQVKALSKSLEEEAAAEERRVRLAAVRAERRASGPARLGKQRFTPAPLAVALSEELRGSMRGVVPLPTLLRDRFVALQRSEKLEPRPQPQRYVRSKRYSTYEPGARGAKELELHAQTLEDRASNKAAREAAAAAARAEREAME